MIRPLEAEDIPAILQIQASTPQAAQWERSAYENMGRAGATCWVAEADGKLAGFLVVRVAVDEMEILNLAVDVDSRRKGIGRTLLRETVSWGERMGAQQVFLEVRASNDAARKFYEKHGFAWSRIRPNYYRDPIEDAMVLSTRLGEKV